MSEIIDLYSKFLLAFIGIVTPALTLFLNNYLIDRTRFESVVKTQEKITEELIKKQFEEARSNERMDGLDFANTSNALLTQKKDQLTLWKEVVKRLDPRRFFKSNLILLVLSLLFLFIWLFIRTEKILTYKSVCFIPVELAACLLTVGLCGWHIINLVRLGFYMIRVRPVVDQINEHIKEEKTIIMEKPKEINK